MHDNTHHQNTARASHGISAGSLPGMGWLFVIGALVLAPLALWMA